MSEALRYPVTADWCDRVRVALKARGAMAKLSVHLKLPRSQLSELLAGAYATSDLVGPIHAYLGWPEPLPPTAILDAGDTFTGFATLPAKERELAAIAIGALRGFHGEQAKRAVAELLQLCRSY